MLRGLPYVFVAAFSIAATLAVVAPAQWLASAVSRATDGHVELADARGTLWRGEANVVLSPGRDAGSTRIPLPERLSWRLSPWPLLAGVADVSLMHPSALLQPLRVRAELTGRIELQAATLRLPAALLAGLGAPFNTIRPGGLVSLNWQRLEVNGGRLQGDIVGEWQFASSALTAVAPFGHYRVLAEGGYPGTRLTLVTVSGALELSGNGTIDAAGRLQFSGRARAAPAADASTRAQLTGLVSLLGRRDGDSAILSIGH